MVTRLLLIRHGEVESRYHRVFGGQIDMDLSPAGHSQAQALADHLSHREIAAIYSSPMKRAQQTLDPLLKSRPDISTELADLREVHFGDWTGLSWEEVLQKYRVSAFQWLEMLECAKVPNGECGPTFRARLEPVLRRILNEHPGETVAIVCHGGVIRMLLSILLRVPLPLMAGFEIEYASLTEVHCEPDKVYVQLLNLTPWRDLRSNGL